MPHPGQGSQDSRRSSAKRWGGQGGWEIKLFVWPVPASHGDDGITDNCLRGICCCSNTWLISLVHAHKRASHFISLSFSPTCFLPVFISIFHCQIHITPYLQAYTHTHRHMYLHIPTHTFSADKTWKRRAAETGGVVLLLLSDLSVVVREQWFVRDLWVILSLLKTPYLTDLLSQFVDWQRI